MENKQIDEIKYSREIRGVTFEIVGRKLDYFARKKREGWDVYGDEVN